VPEASSLERRDYGVASAPPANLGAPGRCGTKDPVTAQGISGAFCDAERTSTALDATLSGSRLFDDAMEEATRERDEHAMPMYEFTCQLASFVPPPPEVQQLLGDIAGNQPAMDAFTQMNAGTISPAEFFSGVS
jgi:hypothetical protein